MSIAIYHISLTRVIIINIFVCCSPDGELLASQGGDPDYMLTVWNWKEEQTVLRSKAFSQDVFRVTFSTELEGQLTTAGTSHVRLALTSFKLTIFKLTIFINFGFILQ